MKTKLKGGSLSGVYLIDDGVYKFIRKEVSLVENREYGFQRWYSQLKKIQRYNHLFPNLFPQLLSYGMNDNMAHFDMEYIPNSVSAHDFVCNTIDLDKINRFFDSLILAMNYIHSIKLQSNKNSIHLYIREEVHQRLNDAKKDREFFEFCNYKNIIFNDQEVTSFNHNINQYVECFDTNYNEPVETFTHGNITLENLMYDESLNKVYFIDPYEENIIDSCLTEYSQILQSCNSKYELYNSMTPTIIENKIMIGDVSNTGLDHFNVLFNTYLKQTLSDQQYISVKLFEISQFIRMLPFKKEIDKNKMTFFYCLASKLFEDIK